MKRAISIILTLATLFSLATVFTSCTVKQNTTDTEKYVFEHTETVIVDFADTAKITGAGLSVVTGEKTAPNGGTISIGAKSNAEVSFVPTNDLSGGMEFVVWINSTAEKNLEGILYAMSDAVETDASDYYKLAFVIKKGWHEYRFPYSEFIEQDMPFGWNNITSLIFSINTDEATTLTFDSVRMDSNKYGTIQGFTYPEAENAVCFYEDCGLYFVDQFRKSMKPGDESVAVKSDDDSTYVPISVLAEFRGATDIVSTAEKTSFTYNGQSYEFKAGDSIEIIGDAQGFRPGKALSLKTLVSGDYVLVPMEKCAEIFGFKLYYNQMGLAVFSDGKTFEDATTAHVYDFIEHLGYNKYNGEELIRRMNTLYPDDQHVRIGANQADFDRLKELIKTDPTYKAWFTRYSAANGKENKNGPYYDQVGYFYLSDGYRLLGMSRDVMERIRKLALMYKLTDDVDYAKRVYKELFALTTFKDPMTKTGSWHPEHFLDTGEIMYGYALGYDWCYDAFTPEERVRLEEAVWELGYGAALGFGDLYDWWQDGSNLAAWEEEQAIELDKPGYKYTGYSGKDVYPYAVPYNDGGLNGSMVYKWHNNWNAVCNGGITAMALAFANVEHPEYDFHGCSALLLDCINYNFPYGLEPSYAPDGGYPEGPGYWSYGTTYSAVVLTALLSATGTTNGMFNNPGFGESFYFICNMSSTAVGSWNYHDAGLGKADTAIFSFYAKLSGDSNIGAYRYDNVTNDTYSVSFWDMVFYDPANYGDSIEMTLDNCYWGIQTITFRSAWDNNAMFCGLHGGPNNASHGQLDIGNFILEYAGTRFFIDLGSDEYNLIGYGNFDFNKDGKPDLNGSVTYFSMPYRHWYYRMRAEGHNTLIINPTKVDVYDRTNGKNQQGTNFDQIYTADAEVLAFNSGKTSAFAVVDMSEAYIDARSGKRGMLVTNNRSTVIIQDEMLLRRNSKILWMGHMAKDAKYEISSDKKTAIITIGGLSLVCSIVVPEGANYSPEFSVMEATYLKETGLTTQAGEYTRDGYMKLVVTTNDVSDYKMAVVCSLLSDGVYDYEYTPIDEWDKFID